MDVKGFTVKESCVAAAIFFCLLFAVAAQAQSTSISGKVTDPAGAVVPGVTVTLTSSTGADRIDITNDVGVYRFLQLAPGDYKIKAELQGFKTTAKDNLQLLVDSPAVLDLALEVGQIAETVTVEAGALRLNTQDAALGSAFEPKRIVNLPLESRNMANLLSLQAAVTPDGYVSGSRSDQSNLTLDGIDVNEQETGEAFSTVIRITPDSLQEFKVTTSTPTAAQGRSSGGQVSLVTKTGTNEWHGSLYEFNRNTDTSANTFFNNRTIDPMTNQTLPRPKLIRNVFGGSISGPIMKDRAFFFYNYEGRRDARETSVVQTVPTATLGQGIVRYKNTDGGITTLTPDDIAQIFPGVGTNPAAIKVLGDAAKRYPANDTTQGDGLNVSGFRFNSAIPLRQNAHTATLNFNLTRDARHVLLLRGNMQMDTEFGASAFPDTPGTRRWSHPNAFMAQETWTVNNNLVNTARFGLTRMAYSQQGDSTENDIDFRYIYYPRNWIRTLDRTTPVYNFVDDLAWIKGNHTWSFGANVRVIRNSRVSFSNSWDHAVANPSYYEDSGAVLTAPFEDIAEESPFDAALCAVIGRYSQYSANYNFSRDGSLMNIGQGVPRTFATEEYELYAQDTWRVRPSLTLTLGLRWGINRPVYEMNGYQVKPNVSLSGYFDKRVAGAAAGTPYNDPFSVDLAGPANGKAGYYPMKKNDFSPRAAFAWQPSFENKLLKAIFGEGKKSVFRGGFAVLYDRIGSQLAVAFDSFNSLGFSSSDNISANTYNLSTSPAPLFTGFDQDIRMLPGMSAPGKLAFPLTTPADEDQRIEASLDDKLTSPRNYSWNFSIGREFGHGLTLEASYVGRSARNLLATRDIMQLNNLVDKKSGMDWYTAANKLYDMRAANVPIESVQKIPYFENLWPEYRRKGWPTSTQSIYSRVSRDGSDLPDWTYLQLVLDDNGVYPNAFFQPQYAALSTWSTIAYSDYHAGTLTLRERFNDRLSFDINYTFSKSIDNASGLQTSGTYASAFIENALRPDDNKSVSDFDMTHIVNANVMYDLPFGKGRRFLTNLHPVADSIFGGWQLTHIFRYNSGLPTSAPFDSDIWATNWNAQSWGARTRDINPSPHKSGENPNFFTDPTYAYHSFRNARPGETGDRNVFRIPSYIALDFGVGKTWKMPFNENHRLQLRAEAFNITNTQRLAGPNRTRSGFGLSIDPQLYDPSGEFGNIIETQGQPRIMQFALRYDF
jgi:hypothetical protein